MRPLHRSCQTSRDFVPWRFRSPVASPVDSFVIPATENLHISGHSAGGQTAAPIAQGFVILPARDPLMLPTAARLLLLFAGGNGRYCGLAIVAEIGEGISDASHFLDAPTFGPALLFYVRAACFSSRRDLGQSCLAHVGKVCDMLLEASGNAEVSRFDVGAGFFDILRAGT